MPRMTLRRIGSLLASGATGFLMLHGALNLAAATPVRVTAVTWSVITASVLALWGMVSLRRRRGTPRE
jgi:hypothetical protein